MIRLFVLIGVIVLSSFTTNAQRGPGRDPWASFGSVRPDTTKIPWVTPPTSVAIILANPQMLANRQGFTIVNFQMAVLPKRGDIIGPYRVKGDKLNAQTIQVLEAQKGSSGKVFFDDIKVKCPDGLTRTLNSVIISYTH